MLEFHRSADVLLVLIIGGAGWLYGGIAGAVVFKVLQDGYRDADAAILACSGSACSWSSSCWSAASA